MALGSMLMGIFSHKADVESATRPKTSKTCPAHHPASPFGQTNKTKMQLLSRSAVVRTSSGRRSTSAPFTKDDSM